jgi:hypothetical protein
MKARSVRGIYEHPAGSGIWWIHHCARWKSTPRKSRADERCNSPYQKRKADARRKLKLPELMPGKAVTFGQLSETAVTHAGTHRKIVGHYKTKDSILREPFAERPADAITP